MAKFLRGKTRGNGRLRAMLAEPELMLVPGAYDALSARLVESTRFPAVYMTGFGTAASRVGCPDVGLLTMTEMVDNARRVVEAVEIPVIADADTGYGDPINVIRTVHEFERAGVEAIHIEDQVSPKKCGHIEGKQVVTPGEMVEKVRAAVAARHSDDFLIIARTDARAVEGLERALERGRLYHEAGADILFIEAPQNEDEIARISDAFPNVPLLFNWAEGGKTPLITLERLRELHFRLVIFPVSTLLAASRAIRHVLEQIRTAGTPLQVMAQMLPFSDFLDFIGLPEIHELEKRFGGAETSEGS